MCLTKISSYSIFKLLSVIYFQNNYIVTMRFLDVKIGALLWRIALLSKPLWCCCYGNYLLETANSVTNCIITVPDCDLPNGTKLSSFMNYSKCSAHFSKGKMLYYLPKFCVFQYTNSICVHSNIFCVCTITSS